MDILHYQGVDFVKYLQVEFKGYDELMMASSHLGDPRNAFLLFFPVVYCLHKSTGVRILWMACVSEWINAILKWVLHGERPFWWVQNSTTGYTGNVTLHQYRLTCETGPGSPSGHAMVTASVVYCLVNSFLTNVKPRLYIKWMVWLMFTLFMSAVCISRLFIATHFPHQVVMGTIVGIGLSVLISWIDLQHLHLSHCLLISVLMPVTCIITFYTLIWLNLDPQWSISLATKYCANINWIHLDTTLFNAAYRDAGSVLGYGLFLFFSSSFTPAATKASNTRRVKSIDTESFPFTMVLSRLPHIIVCLVVCQIGEQMKPFHSHAVIYYCVTFVKFCILVVSVMFIASIGEHRERQYLKNKKL